MPKTTQLYLDLLESLSDFPECHAVFWGSISPTQPTSPTLNPVSPNHVSPGITERQTGTSITTGPVLQTSGQHWSGPCTVALAPRSGHPTAPTWDHQCPPCRQDTPLHPPLPYRGDPDQSSRSPRKTDLTNQTKHPSCANKDSLHPTNRPFDFIYVLSSLQQCCYICSISSL